MFSMKTRARRRFSEGAIMVVYPHLLTSEEKALRRRYELLNQKLEELREAASKQATAQKGDSKSPSSAGADRSKDVLNPKDAREAAKKLLESGKLMIKSKMAEKKTSGFKRVGEGASRGAVPPPTKKPLLMSSSSSAPSTGAGSNGSSHPPPGKIKPVLKAAGVRQVYSRFVKGSDIIASQKIPKRLLEEASKDSTQQHSGPNYSTKECTVLMRWNEADLPEEAIMLALGRFGEIQKLKRHNQSEAFITFSSKDIAQTVKREMNGGMIRGSEVKVEPASEENGYVELPPEVAEEPWAVIAAGMNISESPKKRRGLDLSSANRKITTYEPDF